MSEYFRARIDWNQEDEVQTFDAEQENEGIENFLTLKALHDGDLPSDEQITVEFYIFADKFACLEILPIVSKFLQENLSLSNVEDVVLHSFRLNDEPLMKKSAKFLAEKVLKGELECDELREDNKETFDKAISLAMSPDN